MTIDRAATAWTPHPGGPLRYRANSRFGADGLPPGAWFGRVSAVIEAPDGSVVVFQRGPAHRSDRLPRSRRHATCGRGTWASTCRTACA